MTKSKLIGATEGTYLFVSSNSSQFVNIDTEINDNTGTYGVYKGHITTAGNRRVLVILRASKPDLKRFI